MGITINTNLSSMQAANKMGATKNLLQQNLSRLASGKRINQAADDAAGLAISEELSAQIRSLSQAERNTMDGVSMVQTAEGGMDQATDALIRMRELAIQSGNGTLNDDDRANIDAEMSSLRDEINRISSSTEFNGTKLLDGSATGGINFQVGSGADANDQISVAIDAMDSANLGTDSATLDDLNLATEQGSRDALGVIDGAIRDVSAMRSNLGSTQNTLSAHTNNLANRRENLSAANSRIRDVDVAKETTAAIKNQLLMQSSAAVMAQANGLPAMALSLIG